MAILDQDISASLSADENFRFNAGNERHAQGFTPSMSAKIPYVDLRLLRVNSPTGDITLTLQGDSAGVPDNTPIATATGVTIASALSTSYTWVRFTFPTPPSVVAGTLYHLVITATFTINGTDWVRWHAQQPGLYGRGAFSIYNGATWSAQTDDGGIQQYADVNGGAFLLNLT